MFIISTLIAFTATRGDSPLMASPAEALTAPWDTNQRGRCLTPREDQDIRNAVSVIQTILSLGVNGLHASAGLTAGTPESAGLSMAARVVEGLNQKFVTRILDIAHKFCGTCHDVIDGVKILAQALVDTFNQLLPGNWEHNPVIGIIAEGLNTISNWAKQLCPKESHMLKNVQLTASHTLKLQASNGRCLTAEQDQQIQQSVSVISFFAMMGTQGLRASAMWTHDQESKSQLNQAATLVETVNHQLVSKITQIVGKGCGTCHEIVDGTNIVVQGVLNSMSTLTGSPSGVNNPMFHGVRSTIDSISGFVKTFCPAEMKALMSTSLEAPAPQLVL